MVNQGQPKGERGTPQPALDVHSGRRTQSNAAREVSSRTAPDFER
jgi:hypothetical protein